MLTILFNELNKEIQTLRKVIIEEQSSQTLYMTPIVTNFIPWKYFYDSLVIVTNFKCVCNCYQPLIDSGGPPARRLVQRHKICADASIETVTFRGLARNVLYVCIPSRWSVTAKSLSPDMIKQLAGGG